MLRRGTSLVEVLVVLGIVALLAGLLVPAVGHARKSARSADAMSRLKQLSLAAISYANFNDGWYPPALLYDSSAGLTTISWDFKLLPDGRVEPGPLWKFTDNPGQVQQDPLYTGPTNFGGEPYTGFNYNTTYIGGEAPWGQGWSLFRRGVPPGAWRRPESTAVFGLGGYVNGANKFMRAPGNSVEGDWGLVYSGGQAFRAVGGTTIVAYLDAHVGSASQPRRGAHATPSLLNQTMGFPANGFLSDDDRAYDPR